METIIRTVGSAFLWIKNLYSGFHHHTGFVISNRRFGGASVSYMLLSKTSFFKPVEKNNFVFFLSLGHVIELEDCQDREDHKQYSQNNNGSGNASATADRCTECINSVSEWQVCVDLGNKFRRNLNRISSGRTSKLNYHEYQHQETSYLAKCNVEEVHHRCKCHCCQAGEENCISHLSRRKSVKLM